MRGVRSKRVRAIRLAKTSPNGEGQIDQTVVAAAKSLGRSFRGSSKAQAILERFAVGNPRAFTTRRRQMKEVESRRDDRANSRAEKES